MAGIGFNQTGHEKFAEPGHWNDPDMLVVGLVGWGPQLHPTRLTPDEQYTHMSLWSLLSAPLLIGCDMSRMDDFTLADPTRAFGGHVEPGNNVFTFAAITLGVFGDGVDLARVDDKTYR